MSGDNRLWRLAQLSSLVKDADLMALSAATAQKQAIEARIRALDAAASNALLPAEPADYLRLAAQQGFARLIAERRTVLESKLANASVRVGECRAKAVVSYGRSGAIGKILERARAHSTRKDS